MYANGEGMGAMGTLMLQGRIRWQVVGTRNYSDAIRTSVSACEGATVRNIVWIFGDEEVFDSKDGKRRVSIIAQRS